MRRHTKISYNNRQIIKPSSIYRLYTANRFECIPVAKLFGGAKPRRKTNRVANIACLFGCIGVRARFNCIQPNTQYLPRYVLMKYLRDTREMTVWRGVCKHRQ